MQGILNQQQIALALTAIHTPSASPSDIKNTNSFLNECETHPAFSTTLLSIYREAAHPQLQMSALLLLTNVIKRNWSSKRGGNTRPPWSAALKDDLRNGVLQSYFLHQLRHYKHMNSLLGYLARLDFPQQYPALHQFILTSLSQLAELARTDPGSLLGNNRVLAVLSVCKVVLKEYNHKKIGHNEENFTNYIAAVIQTAAVLSEQIFNQVRRRLEEGGDGLAPLLECLRKADKVVLYCLGSMPSLYQYKQQTQAIAQSYVTRIEEFNSLLQLVLSRGGSDGVVDQVQKYLTGVVEQVGRLQNYFPFLFTAFLREYLFLILKLLASYLPRVNFYRSAKLMSVVVTTNIKPLISFAYYMSGEEFTASVYCKKKDGFDNSLLQAQCHAIFRETYTTETVNKLLQTILCEIMTAPHVLADHKEFSDQLVLQDVEIAIVQQVADPSVYDTCINLLKQVVKCFKEETQGFIGGIIEKVQQLKNNTDRYSQQVMRNILEMVLFLPHVYQEKALPLTQVTNLIGTVYQVSLFNHLSRLIRKYYTYLPLQTARGCFQLLAKVVASPIGGPITPQIIYQAALGLKTLLGGMESDNIPVQVLAGCISNIVTLVGMKEVIVCPTLMWPIINLIIRLVKGLYDIGMEYMSGVAEIIVRGLAPLISAERNEELLVNALVELMATLFYCCFKGIKMNYTSKTLPVQLSERVQGIGKGCLVIFQAAVILLRFNMHNRALENNLSLQRFWLSLMRSYPTLYDQQLYGFELAQTNNKLVEYFNKESQGLMEEEPVIFLELLEEYLITELVDISGENLLAIVSRLMAEEQDHQRRLRLTFAVTSLYHSFSLLRAPVPGIIQILFKQLLELHTKISPQVNGLRTAIFLMLSHRMLTQNVGEMFTFYTAICGGEVGRWLIPMLWNMHFLTNKFAFKLNATVLLKAVTDIGAHSFAELMKIQYMQQYAIDQFLKIITIQLGSVNLEFLANSYQNLTKLLLPNEIVPDFQVPTYRKVRLQLSDPLLFNIAKMDLWGEFRVQMNAVLAALDWSSADIEQRVGETAALQFCGYLGWERKIV